MKLVLRDVSGNLCFSAKVFVLILSTICHHGRIKKFSRHLKRVSSKFLFQQSKFQPISELIYSRQKYVYEILQIMFQYSFHNLDFSTIFFHFFKYLHRWVDKDHSAVSLCTRKVKQKYTFICFNIHLSISLCVCTHFYCGSNLKYI